ncbi:MAG TPA: hypothetical protein VGQ41_03370 [Pyrinomonadaceae bacterium]|jgi:hypothetical protein|nr:hypothetical protein [Pyrinomonadaceae bacterium]
MKILFFFLALVSLTTAQKPALQKDRQVLLDFRLDRKTPAIKIPPATEKSVLSKMFRRYLSDGNRCNSNFDWGGAADPLEAARKAGEIVPSITDMTTGSFTAAGQTQTLYVISVSECNASHADNFGTKRVAIFSGQQLLADVDADFASGIVRKTDLNSDGIDELLMTTGDMAQGTITEMATLVSFQNGRRRVIQDFGAVVEDSCASEMPGATSDASVLYISDIVPGNMPKLTQENYSMSCRGKARRWRLVSRGKRQE